jgi:hypothetical protein
MKLFSRIAFTAALFGLFQPAIADVRSSIAAPSLADLNATRQGMFRALLARQYFKIASCKDFSNLILAQNGLPWLGQDGNVDGLRSNVDRRNENRNPPDFFDSLEQLGGPRNSVEIVASGDRKNWTLTLDRDMKIAAGGASTSRLKTRTEYRFTVIEKENLGSCELLDMSFHAETRGARAFDKSFGLDSCLNLFLKGKPNSRVTAAASNAAIDYLFHDCAVGMHYSLEAKRAAASVR